MQFRKVTVAQLEAAIQQANQDHGYSLELSFTSGRDGNFRARIVPTSAREIVNGRDTGELAPGARYSPNPFAENPRRVKAACWHAFRDVLSALFEMAPDAIVRSGLGREGAIVYNGKAEFEATYPATRYRNVGSEMYPQQFGSLCAC